MMPSEDTKVFEFNSYQNSNKELFIINLYPECAIEQIHEYTNNPENWSITKVSKHIPWGFSMSPISSFRSIENDLDIYRSNDRMKKFCGSLREHAIKVNNCKKKKSSY